MAAADRSGVQALRMQMEAGEMGRAESLRPAGSVEVSCSYPNCRTMWWIDPLDLRLPDGPFDCGDDHKARFFVESQLSLLKIRHGLHWGVLRGDDVRHTFANGAALLHDRERIRQGILTWSSLEELADVDALVARVLWDAVHWPEWVASSLPQAPKTSPDCLRWVGYRTRSSIRKAVFVRCARPGCMNELALDSRDPDYRPESYSLPNGAGSLPHPDWMKDRTFFCEQGLFATGAQPCALIRSAALAEYEQMTGRRWTMWWSHKIRDKGTVLFSHPTQNTYSLLPYVGSLAFDSVDSITSRMIEGPVSELVSVLQSLRGDDTPDEVLTELELHLPSPVSQE
jgi:hypothetical protein